MSAKDELRRMLDERGVEHTDLGGMTEWTNGCGRICRAYTRPEPLTVDIAMLAVPPEQAIAATLGGGECELHECDGSFSAVNRPVWRCDCGAFMTQYTDATTYHKPRYCPNCGRKAVSE